MLPGYFKGLEAAGAVPIMLPLSPDAREALRVCDGLLITGGQDVDPAFYGEERTPLCAEVSEERDQVEKMLLDQALEWEMPVLGICRGIQLINACFGGDLYQDLETQRPSKIEHHMTAPYNRAAHRVHVSGSTRLGAIVGEGELGVNSYHHQAVRRLGRNLQVSAVSEDGLIEGIEIPSHPFFIGVQWHPEFFFEKDKASRALFKAFSVAAQRYKLSKKCGQKH